MAYNQNASPQRGQSTKTDKFGNAFKLVGMKTSKTEGFSKGFVELGGKLYKLELSSHCEKDGLCGWLKVYKVEEKKRVTF